jgi:hypothetical protein
MKREKLLVALGERTGEDFTGDMAPERIAQLEEGLLLIHWPKGHDYSEEGCTKLMLSCDDDGDAVWTEEVQGPTVEVWVVGSLCAEPYGEVPYEAALAFFERGEVCAELREVMTAAVEPILPSGDD